ncbi:sterol desaturase family protein [Zoogloea sp.]|uniref:sterol desaturase family protein n=1 Tax=Zoogloea sp. TaxID=49181 RepID=UPI001416E62A|nr:MAG: fatty acid hydroxylase [Zoogloea sp.]
MREFRPAAASAAFPSSLLIPSLAICGLAFFWLRLEEARWGPDGGMLLAGLIAWTPVEYLLHRFILHGLEPFRRWHLEHHRQPDAPMRTPVVFSLAFVFALLMLPFLLVTDTGAALALSGGLLLGHLVQESVHHRLHRAPRAGAGWLARRQCFHAFHHHDDDAMAFGTLTAFWDCLLGTAPTRRRVP